MNLNNENPQVEHGENRVIHPWVYVGLEGPPPVVGRRPQGKQEPPSENKLAISHVKIIGG